MAHAFSPAYVALGYKSARELAEVLKTMHHAQNMSKRLIAKTLRISIQSIIRLFKTYKIKTINRPQSLHGILGFKTDRQLFNICESLIHQNLSINEICCKIRTSPKTLSKYMKKNDLKTLPRQIKSTILMRSLNKKELQKLHFDLELSKAKIARKFKVHISIISGLFRKYGLSNIVRNHKCADIKLKQKELEILTGCLLGDGHLLAKKQTACFVYTCKHRNVLHDLRNKLPRLFSQKSNIIRRKKINKETGREYICYAIKSLSFKSLLALRRIWYPSHKKLVPKDLKLTKTIGYWWYLGDGASLKNGIHLYTNAFTIHDVNRLMSMMPCNCSILFKKSRSGKRYPVIRIGRLSDRQSWLKFIGKCSHSDYNYRWIIKK